MIFLLGLIVPICFVPGITGASIPTQWVLLSCLLPFGLWRSGPFGPAHWLGLSALAYAAVSIAWSVSQWDALFGLWLLGIYALAFWLGTTLTRTRDLFRGLAWGMIINSGFAIAQRLGYSPVQVSEGIPGLLYNPTVLSASAALVLLAMIEYRFWFLALGIAPGLLLSGSRGGLVILAIGLLVRRFHWSILLGAGALGAIAIALAHGHSDAQRLYLWGLAYHNLTPWGNGIGSFNSVYYIAIDLLFHNPVRMVHPEFVHNDYLQLWFELGIGAIPIYLLYAIALSRKADALWPVTVAFAALSLFYFPLWCPVPAFIGCVTAGRSIATWHRDRHLGLDRGPSLLARLAYFQRESNTARQYLVSSKSPLAH